MGKATARQKNTARRSNKSLLTTKKATSPSIVAGFLFYNNIAKSIRTMTSSVQEQMKTLFLQSFNINSTRITSFIGNSGIWAVSIMNTYINNHVARLKQSVEIEKGSVEPVHILGTFSRGLTYAVKLLYNFGSPITFGVTFAQMKSVLRESKLATESSPVYDDLIAKQLVFPFC